MSSNVPGSSGGSGQDTTNVDQSQVDILSEGSTDEGSEDTVVVEETTEGGEPEAETPSEKGEEEEPTEEEVEEEEIPEEELDETQEPTRPSWKTIKEKYPELAKDKDFRELYFRDKAFTEVFPTVGDAREASTKAEQLDAIDGLLVNGNIDQLFGGLDGDVLLKVSDKLLPALYKVNAKAFSRAARPLIIDVMHNVLAQAERAGDDNLKKSIRNVSRALTGSPDLPTRTTPSEDPTIIEERNRLQQERTNLFVTQERNFLGAADRAVMKKIETLIEDGLDPKGELNSFTRRAILKETIQDVRDRLLSDEGLKNKVQQLHRLAARAGFPDEYRARIISASLERARRLVPVLRSKHRAAALGKQSTKGNTSNKIITKNETVTTGNRSGGSSPSGKIDMKKTSAEDFLHDRVVYRK